MSNAEYLVHLVHMNRLTACREFCGVHRDGVKVLWCHSHPVWLVFEGTIPTCTCSHSENFSDLFLFLFCIV